MRCVVTKIVTVCSSYSSATLYPPFLFIMRITNNKRVIIPWLMVCGSAQSPDSPARIFRVRGVPVPMYQGIVESQRIMCGSAQIPWSHGRIRGAGYWNHTV